RHAGLALVAEGFETDESGADHPCLVPEMRGNDPHQIPPRAESLDGKRPTRRVQDQVAGAGEAAAEDHELRIEDVHERRDPGAKMAPEPREILLRPVVTVQGGIAERLPAGPGADPRLCGLIRGRAGGEAFEVAVTRAPAAARCAAVLENDVPEVGPPAQRAAV